MEINTDDSGAYVLTTWDLYGNVLCKGQGELLDTTGGVLTFSNEVTATVPSSLQCSALGSQTLELSGDSVLWTVPDAGMESTFEPGGTNPGSDAMPYDMLEHSGTWGFWTAEVPGEGAAEVKMASIASAGDNAMTITTGSCTWEFEMVSSEDGTDGDTITVGPGEVTSGSCDPLPPTWSARTATACRWSRSGTGTGRRSRPRPPPPTEARSGTHTAKARSTRSGPSPWYRPLTGRS